MNTLNRTRSLLSFKAQGFLRTAHCFGFAAALSVGSTALADTLYWTGDDGSWGGASAWATQPGGPAATDWISGSDVVIESSSPVIMLPAGGTRITVGLLTISDKLTLRGDSASGNSFFDLTTGGSGHLILSANWLQTQLALEGTSAWDGTIQIDSKQHNYDYIRLNSATSVSEKTKFVLNGGRLILGGTGAINATIGELSGNNAQAMLLGASDGTSLRIEQNSDTTFAGTVGGGNAKEWALSLVKAGSGSLTLSGKMVHRGTTTVESGALYVDGNNDNVNESGVSNSAQGNWFVKSGATLGGSGTIGFNAARNVELEDGGILSPGSIDTPGTLTILNTSASGNTAGLIFKGGAVIKVRLGIPITQQDKIVLDGAWGSTGGGGLAQGGANSILFDLANYNGNALVDTYDLIVFAHTPGISLDSYGLTADSIAAGWEGNFKYSGNVLQFEVTRVGGAIPEASTYAITLGGLAALAAFSLRRPRRHR